MTLADIGRMLRLAKVPRSKTIQITYPNPRIILHVPMTHYMLCAEVVGRLRLVTDNVQVAPLDRADEVGEGQHVVFKMKGIEVPFAIDPDWTRYKRIQKRKAYNRTTVIDFATVSL